MFHIYIIARRALRVKKVIWAVYPWNTCPWTKFNRKNLSERNMTLFGCIVYISKRSTTRNSEWCSKSLIPNESLETTYLVRWQIWLISKWSSGLKNRRENSKKKSGKHVNVKHYLWPLCVSSANLSDPIWVKCRSVRRGRNQTPPTNIIQSVVVVLQ